MKRLIGFLAGFLFSFNLAYAQNTWTGALGAGLKPASSIGKEADWFVDTNTYSFWGPKTSNSWGSSASGTITPALPAFTGDCISTIGTSALVCLKTNGTSFTSTATAAAGQLPGTATNDSATAGNVGEYISAGVNTTTNATVTITIATPAVITWTAHPFTATGTSCHAVNFATSSALPTGIVASTNYYVISSSITANTFQIATTVDNCIAGTAINTSGSQSGTQTGIPTAALATTTAANVAGLRLTPGEWDVNCISGRLINGATVVTFLDTVISSTSAASDSIAGSNTLLVFGSGSTIASSGAAPTLIAGPRSVKIASPTTYYCFVFDSFITNTDNGYALMRARRVR